MKVTAMWKAGVVVSAGHTNASLDDFTPRDRRRTFGFTHLGNGCPLELPRHDNVIQRALSCSTGSGSA